ncbi:cell death abnormality protein 1-like [Mya arenaria]|uniref:cell death abnormality protein 1-like n=1 Tax=Mya arenaria TaxID=6604 RepID=UPI0022E4AB55|nr:cell death abnormality protein 1-like [Mya arenaria]
MELYLSSITVLVLCQIREAKCDWCPGRCQCCLNDICGDYLGHNQACKDGCKDGYHQARCMWPCSENCQSCNQMNSLCLICKPGFYAPSDECSHACEYRNCACAQTDCDYCLDGFYDVSQHCNSACSKGCIEGKCNDTGSCDCVEHFKGNKCDMCELGKYGELCNDDCINDNCECTNSTNCISCKNGYLDFSSFCSKSCSVGCKNICNNEGHCSCHSQFTGSNCENCKLGYYGHNCTTQCTNGCINGTCNRDGTCDCLPNFTGARCETCVVGHYGDSCDKPCGLGCTGNICNKDDGTCICEYNYKGAICDICNDGYFGIYCNSFCPDRCYNCSSIEKCLACKEGFFGLDCTHQCSANCLGSRCDKCCGLCTDGCMDGFTAAACNDKCDSICKACSQTNHKHCLSCFGGYSGPSCKCLPNCQCELNSEPCNGCTNGFEIESKYCKCNKKYCVDYLNCRSCLNHSFYTYNGTCCECSTNCRNGQCVSEDHCLNGCEDGYTGADCSDLCIHHDVNCIKCSQVEQFCVICKSGFSPNTESVCARQCSDTCFNKECDAKTGRCLQGCNLNFYAEKCDLECPSTCASVPNKTRCDNYGRCLHGCIEGYTGVTCINATTANTGNSSAGGLIGGAVGGASTIIFVIIGIVLCIQRRKRKKKQSESGSQLQIRDPNPFIIEEQERHYQQLSDRHNTTAGVQEETYNELQTNNTEYERVDI